MVSRISCEPHLTDVQSDGEVDPGRCPSEDELAFGIAAEVFHCDAVEFGQEGVRCPCDGGADDLVDEARGWRGLVVGRARRHGSTHDLPRGDPPALLRELISPSGATDPLENAVADEG